jgi:hypothetical protein
MGNFEVREDRPQYAAVPQPLIEAVRSRSLPYSALGLYAVLDSFRNRRTRVAYPGLRRLHEGTGLAVRTLRRLLGCLEAVGFIRIEKPTDPSHPQVYYLLYSPEPRLPDVRDRVAESDTRRVAPRGSIPDTSCEHSLLPIPSESEPREPSSPTAIPKKAKWRMTDEEWRRLAQEDNEMAVKGGVKT